MSLEVQVGLSGEEEEIFWEVFIGIPQVGENLNVLGTMTLKQILYINPLNTELNPICQ